jgi:hypothetical protein
MARVDHGRELILTRALIMGGRRRAAAPPGSAGAPPRNAPYTRHTPHTPAARANFFREFFRILWGGIVDVERER